MTLDRRPLLCALIAYELPIEPVLAQLSAHGWDIDEPLVTLGADDVVRVLDRYLEGQLTSQQVAEWADLVECREDIELPQADGRSVPVARWFR
jgi:hypothetical protein